VLVRRLQNFSDPVPENIYRFGLEWRGRKVERFQPKTAAVSQKRWEINGRRLLWL